MDYSPPDSSVHGILQARMMEQVAISSSRGSSQHRDQTHVSCVSCTAGRFLTRWVIQLKFVDIVTKSCQTLSTPRTITHQAPLSMGCSRQEYWSGLPFPSPGDLPDTGIEPGSPALQAVSLLSEPSGRASSSENLSFPWAFPFASASEIIGMQIQMSMDGFQKPLEAGNRTKV